MKKIISLTLALAIVLSMSVCAFATTTTNTVTTDGGSQRVELKGEVLATADLISVVMPTTLTFQVGTETTDGPLASDKDVSTPDVNDGGNTFKNFVGSTGTVTNNSTCAIDLKITSVIDTDNLTNKMNLYIIGSANEFDYTALDATAISDSDPVDLISALPAGQNDTLKIDGAEAFAGRNNTKIALDVGTCSVTAIMKVTKAS